MIGKFINDYEIDEVVDKGGMSTVFLGVHRRLKRKAAIKMLNPVLATNPSYVERFKNEALLLSMLNHPNIIALYDYVENDAGYFLITEYVEGQTLDNYIDEVTGPMPESKAIKLMLQILDAIGHIHSRNVIHRDIKPGNFIVTADDNIKVLDFGIAKSIEQNSPLFTKDGSKVGTTIFMSPQQVRGQVLDRRSDIYSLGATMFQMLTGQYPYDRNQSEYDIFNKIVNDEFPDPKDFYVGVSDKMRNIIKKATQKKPLDRFQSCDEFSLALLSGQKKNIKNASVSLKTKIIEAADIEIFTPKFNNTFWQNLTLVLSSILFTAMIVAGVYLLTRKEVRRVVGGNTVLLANDTITAAPLENLNYGEIVRLIGKPLPNAEYQKVYSLRNTAGYIPNAELSDEHTYKQINSILANNYAGSEIPANFKFRLRNYFLENNLFGREVAEWTITAEPYKSYELNNIAFGDFNTDSIADFACVLQKSNSENQRLVIMFGAKDEYHSVDFSEDIKISTAESGPKGSRWFLGETTIRKTEKGSKELKKYNYLDTDALLVFKSKTKENVLYLYNNQEKMLNFYSQSN